MRPADLAARRRFANAYTDPTKAVLEGFHPVCHALRFGATLEAAVTYDRAKLTAIAQRLAPDVLPAIDAAVHEVDRVLFDRLSPRRLSSPLMGVVARPEQDPAGPFARLGRPVVFLERPQDPGNVGAVIRVAAAADVAGVVMTGNVDPWSPVVLRSATGLQFALPCVAAALPEDLDRPLVTLDPSGEALGAATLDPGSVLVVGGERYGISASLAARAERSVAIPMRPGVSSLNLATAVAAVLFSWKEAVRAATGIAPW